MSKTRVYQNAINGYCAVLYGKSSMKVLSRDFKELFHTESRTVNTEDEVMEMLENFPQFLKEINK